MIIDQNQPNFVISSQSCPKFSKYNFISEEGPGGGLRKILGGMVDPFHPMLLILIRPVSGSILNGQENKNALEMMNRILKCKNRKNLR